MNTLLPPRLVLLLSAISLLVGLTVPLAGPVVPWVRWLLVLPLTVGIWLTVGGAAQFAKAGTNIVTTNKPDLLVTDGRFRLSRNPMYVGFALVLVAVALGVGTATAWIWPIVFVVVAHRWYIPFEERRMAEAFGEDYSMYCQRVGRWLAPIGRAR